MSLSTSEENTKGWVRYAYSLDGEKLQVCQHDDDDDNDTIIYHEADTCPLCDADESITELEDANSDTSANEFEDAIRDDLIRSVKAAREEFEEKFEDPHYKALFGEAITEILVNM